MDRFLRVWLLPLAVLGTTFSNPAAGARVPEPPSAEMRASLGTVAVVAGRFVPESNFITFAEGEGKEIAKGMAREITDALPGMHPSSALVQRLLTALARETTVPIRSVDALGPGSPKEKPSYESLRARGVDTVLEVAVTNVGLVGGDQTPLIALAMVANTRLVRVADNSELYARVFGLYGRTAPLDAWVADNTHLLTEQFMRGYEDLADQIATTLFLLTPMKVKVTSRAVTPACWLEPTYPKLERGPMRHHNFPSAQPGKLLYPVVDSLQPRLQWKAFLPEKRARGKHPPISDVRYDLRIWKAEGGYPEPLVYDREGLPESSHELTRPLEPGTQYFWSVRARFKVDGRDEVTRWAFITNAFVGCNVDQIPTAFDYIGYHRFATPKP